MRLFVALPLDSRLRERVQAITAPLRSANEGARWSEPGSWHVTLQFLGQCTAEQLACVQNALTRVKSPPIPFSLGETGIFGSPGVLYLEVILSRDLATLQQRVVEATTRCGFAPEARPYRPHVTLARMKRSAIRDAGQKLGSFARGLPTNGLRSQANEFCLYESRTESKGSRYEVLARFPMTSSMT